MEKSRPMPHSDSVREILDYALDHHSALCDGDGPFTGAPISPADLQDAANTVARFFRLDDIARRIALGESGGASELHTLVMTVWAGGFKAGARYAS
jgi:hypothetical protein